MQARTSAVITALVAAVALASVAAAEPRAAKQRVEITMSRLPSGTFQLVPLSDGRVKADSGSVGHLVANYTPRVIVRDGQSVQIFEPVVWRLSGKRGTLVIREPANAWVKTGDADIGTGTWKVVRGTGQYAGVTGRGRSAHVGHNGGTGSWYARQEGFLIAP